MPRSTIPGCSAQRVAENLSNGTEQSDGNELPDGKELVSGIELGRRFIASLRPAAATTSPASPSFTGTTGFQVLELARRHLGEPYILGARAPMADSRWAGPWDCAELVSWCVYQASGVLFGTRPRGDPMLADAYTGYWDEQAAAASATIDWRDAAGIAGAAVLRRPSGGHNGHIVFSDGKGGTVEAHSRQRGVMAGSLSDRRWDCGILVPGIRYLRADTTVAVKSDADPLRITDPLTSGSAVLAVQQCLSALGFLVGAIDSIYGPQTAHAVRAFQASKGLVADGEAGRQTLAALDTAPTDA